MEEVKTMYREARKQAGIRPERAAAELGVSITTLLSWERNDTRPNADNIRKMAQLYGMSADVLIGV